MEYILFIFVVTAEPAPHHEHSFPPDVGGDVAAPIPRRISLFTNSLQEEGPLLPIPSISQGLFLIRENYLSAQQQRTRLDFGTKCAPNDGRLVLVSFLIYYKKWNAVVVITKLLQSVRTAEGRWKGTIERNKSSSRSTFLTISASSLNCGIYSWKKQLFWCMIFRRKIALSVRVYSAI